MSLLKRNEKIKKAYLSTTHVCLLWTRQSTFCIDKRKMQCSTTRTQNLHPNRNICQVRRIGLTMTWREKMGSNRTSSSLSRPVIMAKAWEYIKARAKLRCKRGTLWQMKQSKCHPSHPLSFHRLNQRVILGRIVLLWKMKLGQLQTSRNQKDQVKHLKPREQIKMKSLLITWTKQLCTQTQITHCHLSCRSNNYLLKNKKILTKAIWLLFSSRSLQKCLRNALMKTSWTWNEYKIIG